MHFILFPTSYISKQNPTILPSRLSFEVKITDVNNFYELNVDLVLTVLE